MANVDARFGLKPVRTSAGSPFNMNMARRCVIPATYGTALYIGDPVVKINTGSNSSAVGGTQAGVLTEINIATAGGGVNSITGVIVGLEPDRDNLSRQYWAASTATARVAYVCTDPNMIYHIQADDSVTATQIGLNADFVLTHSGSTISGRSGCELDIGTANTTATLQLSILGLADIPDNELASANPILEVMINTSTEGFGSTTHGRTGI